MYEFNSGLLGALIGGSITIIVTIIAFIKEINIWKRQFEAQRVEEMKMLKAEKFASFLGALFYIEGSIGDILDILENEKEDALEILNKKAYEPDFEKSIVTINNEKGWVFILPKDKTIISRVSEIEKIYDEIQTVIKRVGSCDLAMKDAFKIVQVDYNKLKDLSKVVSELMRDDVNSN